MTLALPRPPSTDAEWARETERRLRALEQRSTFRAGPWVISSNPDDELIATKPGDSMVIDGNGDSVKVNLGADRGFTLKDKEETVEAAKDAAWKELYEKLSGSAGPGQALQALADYLNKQFNSPVDALRIFGQLLPGQIPNISVSHIATNFEPELLSNPKFNGAISMSGQSLWTWDETKGHDQPGSALTNAEGVERELLSNYIIVDKGQKLRGSVWTTWQGLVSTGSAIRLEYALFQQGAPRGTLPVDAIVSAPSSSGWTKLSGSVTIPENVDSVRLRLVVSSTATAGQVWFDDGSASKFGLLPQGLVDGLSSILGLFRGLFDAVGGKGDTAVSDIEARLAAIALDGKFDAAELTNLANSVIQTLKDTIGGTLGAGWADIQKRLSGLANDGKLFVEKILGQLPHGQVTSPVGGGSLGQDFGEIIDNFWNVVFGGAATGKTTADFAAATQALKQRTDDAYAYAVNANEIVNMPRLTPRWMSTGNQDDVSFPIISAQTTFTPPDRKLVLIPISPDVERLYRSVKFAMTGNGMGQIYVGLFRVQAVTNSVVLAIDLGNVKSLISGTSKVQSLTIPGSGFAVGKGETVFIGILQVGNPQQMFTTPGIMTALETVQTIPLFFTQDGGSSLTSLPASVTTAVEFTPAWGALGEAPNLAEQWTDYSSTGTNLPVSYYNIPGTSQFLWLAGAGGGGGGGGGDGGWNKPGEGGGGGAWGGRKLERGVDIGSGVTQIRVCSEKAGVAGAIGGEPGGKETDGKVGHDIVFRSWPDGAILLTCAGGRLGRLAYGSFYNRDPIGYGPGNFAFGGRLFLGGANTEATPAVGGQTGQSGNRPGGGGAGGGGGTGGNAGSGGWGAPGYAAIKAS